jgi:DNA-directed RNA polymerase specialized sigma24 family protein
MLFKANISTAMLHDDDLLVEQLYIFLNEFVKTRIRYESSQTVEDCVQDTVMYLIKRLRIIPEPVSSDFNPEQFFYNRANSYVSMWLRRLINNRRQFKKYQGDFEYIKRLETDDRILYINHDLLNDLIKTVLLLNDDKQIVRDVAIQRLVDLGYSDDIQNVVPEELYKDKPIDTIIYNIVDKYLSLDINQEE